MIDVDSGPVCAPIARTKNDLGTPEWFLKSVRRLGAIILDPCSNPWSTVDAYIELSAHRGEDGLSADWSQIILSKMPDLSAGGFAFINPPYGPGFLRKWAEKMIAEARKGVEIVTLLPCSPDTLWWEWMRDDCDARCDVARRIGFDGGEHGAGQVRSEVFYFGPRPYLFGHCFSEIGEIMIYRKSVKP